MNPDFFGSFEKGSEKEELIKVLALACEFLAKGFEGSTFSESSMAGIPGSEGSGFRAGVGSFDVLEASFLRLYCYKEI